MNQPIKQMVEVYDVPYQILIGVDVLNFPVYHTLYKMRLVEVEVPVNKHITRKKK